VNIEDVIIEVAAKGDELIEIAAIDEFGW